MVMQYAFYCFIVLLLASKINSDRLDEKFRILYSDAVKCNFNKSLELDVRDTKVYFYDFANSITVVCGITDINCIQRSIHLETSKRFIFFVPGYKCHIKRDIEEWMRETYRNVPDIYFMIVDHSAYTYETNQKLLSYERSVLYSYYIGKQLGIFLSDLHKAGYPSKNLHGIGHSLGAHILGFAGEMYKAKTSELLGKITGLDPAGPCFTKASITNQLRTGNALYVEIYHCNAGHLGTTNINGDIDFFFNQEGKIQPDCQDDLSDEDLAKCYHRACVKYWTKSVHHQHLYPAVACTSYKEFSEGRCDRNHQTLAGFFNPGNTTGVFYVSTSKIET